MNTLNLSNERILSVTAHPDDLEMMHLQLLSQAKAAFAYVATDGKASSIDYHRGSLCRPRYTSSF